MKSSFAFLLIIALLAGVLSGCGAVEPGETTLPTETTEATPTPIGTLYVSFGATLEMTYDEAGNALTITGTNEIGKTLAEAKQDQLNKGCVYALRSILRYAITENLLGDTKTVVVRIGAGDSQPTEDFLFVIGQDCQYLLDEEVSDLDMHYLTGDMLDENGDLTFDTAQMLATKYLGGEAIAAEATAPGVYTFTAGDKSCTVDAFTGQVRTQ